MATIIARRDSNDNDDDNDNNRMWSDRHAKVPGWLVGRTSCLSHIRNIEIPTQRNDIESERLIINW